MEQMTLSVRQSALAGAALLVMAAACPANAASPTLSAKLAPEIGKRCLTPADGYPGAPIDAAGIISARDLADAFEASGVVPLTAAYGRPWTPESVAEQAFPIQSADIASADAKYYLLRRLIRTAINPGDPAASEYLPLADGGFSVQRRNGVISSEADERRVLADILRGESSDFVFFCAPLSLVGDGGGGGGGRNRGLTWYVAKTPDDFAKPLRQRDHAEASATRDMVAGDNTYSLNAALGVSLKETLIPLGPGALARISPSAFLQFERNGGDGVASETNNLVFGAQAKGLIHLGAVSPRTHLYSFDLTYQTDDDFQSRVWSASALFTPQLLPLGWGNLAPWASADGRYAVVWTVSAVADWSGVDDPGAKADLAGKDEFGRLGLDVDAEWTWRPTDDPWKVSLSGAYGVRKDLTNNGADAELFTGKLLLLPNDHLAFGVTYSNGENLKSLEFGEQWRLSFGYRY